MVGKTQQIDVLRSHMLNLIFCNNGLSIYDVTVIGGGLNDLYLQAKSMTLCHRSLKNFNFLTSFTEEPANETEEIFFCKHFNMN